MVSENAHSFSFSIQKTDTQIAAFWAFRDYSFNFEVPRVQRYRNRSCVEPGVGVVFCNTDSESVINESNVRTVR